MKLKKGKHKTKTRIPKLEVAKQASTPAKAPVILPERVNEKVDSWAQESECLSPQKTAKD